MTTSLPSISIGISFFNAEDTLLDAVRSVFAQTHQQWELILMDDGSTDRSLEIARSINDPRVRVYSDGQNKKLATRLNEINSLANFDLIARMDADDFMARDRLERQIDILVRNADIDLVATGIYSLNNQNMPVGRRCISSQHQITPRGLLEGQSGIVHASVVFRKKWTQRNPYREDLPKSQDTNLWVRAYSKNDLRAHIIPEPLYYYQEDSAVTSKKLLLGYSVTRITASEDAGKRFPRKGRIRAIGVSYTKSFVVKILASIGRLDFIRQRRNCTEINADETSSVMNEIECIQNTKLPIVI